MYFEQTERPLGNSPGVSHKEIVNLGTKKFDFFASRFEIREELFCSSLTDPVSPSSFSYQLHLYDDDVAQRKSNGNGGGVDSSGV